MGGTGKPGATGLGDLGLAYADPGDTARARGSCERALAIFEAFEHPNADRVREWLEGLDG